MLSQGWATMQPSCVLFNLQLDGFSERLQGPDVLFWYYHPVLNYRGAFCTVLHHLHHLHGLKPYNDVLLKGTTKVYQHKIHIQTQIRFSSKLLTGECWATLDMYSSDIWRRRLDRFLLAPRAAQGGPGLLTLTHGLKHWSKRNEAIFLSIWPSHCFIRFIVIHVVKPKESVHSNLKENHVFIQTVLVRCVIFIQRRCFWARCFCFLVV